MTSIIQSTAESRRRLGLILGLGLVSAIAYNSWPLGFWLSKSTAEYGLASDLEKVGHPYYWLFILGDILAGMAAILLAITIRFRLRPALSERIWSIVSLGLFMFGIFTIIDALLPADCTITVALKCQANYGHGIGIDAILSGLAALGLAAGLLCLNHLKLTSRLRLYLHQLNQATLAAWAASAIVFCLLSLANLNAHLVQQLLISLSGLAIIVIILNLLFALQLIRDDTN